MGHMPKLTPDQYQRWVILKNALAGDADAIERVVLPLTEDSGFGAETKFVADDTLQQVSSVDDWENLSDFEIDVLGGRYLVHLLIFFGNPSSIARSMELRFLANGVPVGETLSHEAKDLSDTYYYTTFNEYVLAPGQLDIQIQGRVVGGAMTFDVNRVRMSLSKVADL